MNSETFYRIYMVKPISTDYLRKHRAPYLHVRTTAQKTKSEGFFFLHRIVTGDEKWIHYDNPKRRKSSVKPGHASTSTAKPNIHGKKLMLCIWWDQLGVIYYELLQPNETITGERYQQQLMRLSRALKIKRPLYAKRHDKVIYQHDNALPHVAKVVKETLEALQWDVLPHPLYSPDIAPSDYHMFRSMTHGLAEQHFTSYEEAKNWVNVWIVSKDEEFFRHGIRYGPSTLPLRLKGLTASNAKKNTKRHYCHKIGHWSRECRKRLANEKNKSKNLHDSKGSSSDYGLILCDNQVEPNDIWYADSGASCSMTFRREWFKTYTSFTSDHPIYLGDNSTLLAEGMGDIEIQAYVDGGWYNTYIRNVLYSPQLKKNLYSLSTSTRRGFNVIIKHDKLQIFMDNDLKAVGVRHDGLYRMLFKVTSSSQGYITSENKLQLWHERLAHLPVATLREMATKGLVDGLQPQDLEGDFFFCEGCQLGKAHRKSCYPSDGKNYQQINSAPDESPVATTNFPVQEMLPVSDISSHPMITRSKVSNSQSLTPEGDVDIEKLLIRLKDREFLHSIYNKNNVVRMDIILAVYYEEETEHLLGLLTPEDKILLDKFFDIIIKHVPKMNFPNGRDLSRFKATLSS
ncbi:hypothetical protein LAZ67_6001426 [Cordylochernes scorpioides]|uniref:Uncharacterized protein n=1 Tax=Cordylochernes scorpioides TaxID=51811 RepID=A0ABY6KJ69_9ARAC|nr:hypothetical protein LAZ67_6001426 [Cordylochernes scorpioides]